MTGVTVKLEGATTAKRILRDFEYKIRRRIVTAAVRAGCREIVKEARARCPVATGTLKRQIKSSVKLDRVSGNVSGTVKPKSTGAQRKKGMGKGGRYLHLVVSGTRPHEIPKPGHEDVIVVNGQPYSRVQHPGARAQPFMDAAANHAMPAALKAFTFKLDQRISQEAAKLRASQ